MHNRYFPVAAFALAFILAGCKQALPPAAPDTHEADLKAVRDFDAANIRVFAARDLDKIAASYAVDASGLYPDSPVLHGVAAIMDSWKPLLADKNFSITYKSDKVDVAKSGELGYAQSTYTMTMTDPKTRKVLTLHGKYVVVCKKQADGGWKIVADIGNEDAPPAPAKK
jgi:ketosteroid isomerase-like protein